MFKHYLRCAMKSLLKFKLFSIINILGLAIGLAASIIISIFVQHEFSYDKQWENSEQIYKVVLTEYYEGLLLDDGRIPNLVLPAMQDYFSNVVELTAYWNREYFMEVNVGGDFYKKDIYSVSESYLDMFQYHSLNGNLNEIFANTNSIALSNKVATQWYGSSDPLGQVISVKDVFTGEVRDYQVKAVFVQESGNSVINVDITTGNSKPLSGQLDSKRAGGLDGFVKLSDGVDLDSVRLQLPDFTRQYISNEELGIEPDQELSDVFGFALINIGDLYFDPIYCSFWDSSPCGNFSIVSSFAVISLLVLLVACVNYIILALAKSAQRAREVALRKAFGASPAQLILQFLIESIAVIILALFLALSLVEVFLPVFKNIMGLNASLDYSLPVTYLSLFILLVSVSLFSGLYPALSISRIKPAPSLKSNQTSSAQGVSRLRSALLLFQFSISISLLIATAIAFAQLRYIDKLDLGYSAKNLIELNLSALEARVQGENLLQEISDLPQVENATLSGMDPGQNGGVVLFADYKSTGARGEEISNVPTIPIGFNFFETFQMPLITGRIFERGRDREEPAQMLGRPQQELEEFNEGSLVLNEAAIKLLGFDSPEAALGQTIQTNSFQENGEFLTLSIIGVVRDSQFRDLRQVAGPEAFRLSPDLSFFLTVKYTGNPQNLLTELEIVWEEVVGDAVFSANFIAEETAAAFQEEKRHGILLISCALLAVFIACLGLYGVTAFTIDRRTKEIGIRKVMGAEVKQIVIMLVWQFSKPVLLANLLAWPVAVWAMLKWLQRFPYQIDTLWLIPLCVLAGFIALSIAWLTVVSNTMKVATTKPVLALRYE